MSLIARPHGVAPHQLFTWHQLVVQGGLTAAGSGEELCRPQITEPCKPGSELHRLLGNMFTRTKLSISFTS